MGEGLQRGPGLVASWLCSVSLLRDGPPPGPHDH